MSYTEKQIQEMIDKEVSKLELESRLIQRLLVKMKDPGYARDAAIKLLHTREIKK